MQSNRSDGLLHETSQLGARTLATTSNFNPNVVFEALGANHSELMSMRERGIV